MLQKFTQALTNNCKVNAGETILVALSGGADSVALLHLFLNAGYDCLAVHCNFSLREAESDEDEAFVKLICEKLKTPIITERFNTTQYAKENKLSIEMAARQLRYDLFEKIAKKHNILHIATGHHGDDSIETFFLNLTRGTGIKGLTGISWRNNNIIRPLLFASTNDIVEYCKNNKLNFRTDHTNSDTIYLRNKIRHELIPKFREINPSFFETMQNNMFYLQEACEIFHNEIERVKQLIVAKEDDSIIIPIKHINTHQQKHSILFEILKPYGFNGDNIKSIIDTINSNSGKQFFSNEYRVVIDRYNIILTPYKDKDENTYTIEENETLVEFPIKLQINRFAKTNKFSFSKDPLTAHFDADLIDFPLSLRLWHAGDKFQPLGMNNFKKISDFFIDNKLSLIDKEKTWLILNGNDIIWIAGIRMDNRFKINEKTRIVLEIKILE